MFEMLERAEVNDFVVESNFKYERAPSGPLARSRATSNLINQSETVRNYSTSCFRPLKDTTKSYYRQLESCESESWNTDTKCKDKSQNETSVYDSEREKSRAHELGFGNYHSTSCLHPFKDNTQSYNHLSQSSQVKSLSHVKGFQDYDQSNTKQIKHSGMEKRRAHGLGFGINYRISCSRPFKDNTQSFYQPNI